MNERKDVIALVGAGKGGAAILEMLLAIPGTEVKYVFDMDPEAPGILLARKHGIACRTDGFFDELSTDPEVDLILEVTGKPEVFDTLRRVKHERSTLLVAGATRIIFHLLDVQRRATERLEKYRRTLEERIIERTEEIEKANRELQEKIIEYEKLTQDLQRMNEEKTRYLLHATHQLKAPFAAIQSYADIIVEGYTGPITEQTRDIMGKIKVRCELLAHAIKEMLDLASLRSCDRDSLPMKEEHLSDMIAETIERFAVVADKRRIRIRFDSGGPGDVVRCHRGQIVTLFSALLENAINYSHEGSEIEIAISRPRRNRVVVSFRDQGIGITEACLPKIFNEHFRADDAVRMHENGTGLGLAIAREVASIHHFYLEVESQVGKGSVFTLTAPSLGPPH